jgi:ATP-dependent DNA helicase RecG
MNYHLAENLSSLPSETEAHRSKVMEFVRTEIKNGRQVYVIYPLIEESEKLDLENLMEWL